MFLCSFHGFSQTEKQSLPAERPNSFAVFGGMGIHVVSAPEFVQYINTISVPSQRVDDFGTAVDFFGGIEFPVDDDWAIKIEHSYLFKSYSIPGNLGGTYDLYYSVQAPSVLVQKVVSGRGYFVKFGAGGGYHLGYASQTVSTFNVTTEYTAHGAGVLAEIVGQTAFDDNFFAYIGSTIGWEFMSSLKDHAGNYLSLPTSTLHVSLRYFHAGIRFGVVQYF